MPNSWIARSGVDEVARVGRRGDPFGHLDRAPRGGPDRKRGEQHDSTPSAERRERSAGARARAVAQLPPRSRAASTSAAAAPTRRRRRPAQRRPPATISANGITPLPGRARPIAPGSRPGHPSARISASAVTSLTEPNSSYAYTSARARPSAPPPRPTRRESPLRARQQPRRPAGAREHEGVEGLEGPDQRRARSASRWPRTAVSAPEG